jgi:hypothetical protein
MRLGQNEAKYKRKGNDEPKSSLPFQYLDIYFQFLDEKGHKEPISNEIRPKRSKIKEKST